MATGKKASKKAGKKTTKKSSKKSSKASTARAGAESGPVPPYGEAIRGAVARGDELEMRTVAANARKWLADVQSALAQLETAIKSS